VVKIGTAGEILASSTQYIDDYRLGLQFPACDWSGYFLFSTLAGDGPCQAVNLGLCVGHPQGSQVGVPAWRGDPRKIFVITSVICDGISYRSLDDESYTRRDLVYSRRGLDVQIADVARIKGSWPDFELYFLDKRHDIVYELAGSASFTHYVPDHVYNNVYDYVVFPDFSFRGTITVKGVEHEVNGLGGLDHVAARVFESPSNPGVGFWQYDTIHWEGDLVTNALYYVDDAGSPVVSSGMMTIPDGAYHPCGSFEVEFLEMAEGTANAGSTGPTQLCPRAWRARLAGEHGVLEYTTEAVPVRSPSGEALVEPNVVYRARGRFRSSSGVELELTGKGFNEYMGGSRHPAVAHAGAGTTPDAHARG
jgi:hypothetical protein